MKCESKGKKKKVKSQIIVPKYDLGFTNSGNGFGASEKFRDFLKLFFDFF